MPITRHEALTADRFHEDHEPAGKVYEWRRNGATQTWKTRPEQFRVPVKYGMRSYSQITETDAGHFHTAEQCPTRHVTVNGPGGITWQGIVISELIPDRAGYGITRVQVTRRGTSRHRVGSQLDVGTKTITYL
jgi:hypothetical protein